MKRVSITAITIFALSVPFQANSDDTISGNYISEGCEALAGYRNAQDDASRGKFFECAGAIKASMQMMEISKSVCAPDTAIIQQGASGNNTMKSIVN